MKRERSAGAIVFRRENGEIKFLLLHYKFKSEYWDFPKGHIEKGESEVEAAKREVYEETGIKDLKIYPAFREISTYFFRQNKELVEKTVVYFLAETKQKDVRISYEHIGYGWFSFEEAVKMLKPESRRILEKAKAYLGI